MDRGRWRTAYNRLMCGTAVLAIGLSGWTLWGMWDRWHTVDEACAGLVPARQVLALSGGGGEVAADEEIRPGDSLPQRCSFRTEEVAEKAGREGQRLFFSVQVATEPTGWKSEPVDDSFQDPLKPSNPYVRVPLVHQPIGGGVPGYVGDSGAAVRLPCPGGKHRGREITGIRTSAVLQTGAFAENGQLTRADRDRLADIAVATANNFAAEVGCPGRLPEAPDGIPALNTETVDPDDAEGTCAWYGAADLDNSSGWLPDQALESRADELVWQERCLLTVSGEARGATHLRYLDDPAYQRYREADRGRGRWWLSAESFFGDAAEHVSPDTVRDDRVVAIPGRGGYDDESNAWWATSVCDGEPAVHVLTAGYPYVHGAGRHLEPVFRAYVEDVAERRGCTDVVLPTADDFARAD